MSWCVRDVSDLCAKNSSICIKDTAPTFLLRNAHFWLKIIQNCHHNSFELKYLQSSILCTLRSISVSCEKRSVLIKKNLCFGKRFRAVKILCKNSSICIKDNAPTFFNQKSKYPPDTAHTNSSRGGEPPLAESWHIITKLLITGSVTHYFR